MPPGARCDWCNQTRDLSAPPVRRGTTLFTYGGCDDVPGLIPIQALEIDQDALQLNNGKGRVSVVELDGDLVRKLFPRPLGLLETAHNIVQRSSHPEVLLLKPELLAA